MVTGSETHNRERSGVEPDAAGDRLRLRIRESAERLHVAIRDLIDQIPVSVEGPQAFASKLGVHKALATKMLSAVRLADPIAVIRQMPRSEGLGIFLRAAKSSVSEDGHGKAKSAVADFQNLVKQELGGWHALEAAISSWLPEARAEAELANNRQVYNGLRGAFGVTADVTLGTMLLWPSSDGEHYDVVITSLTMGLRRLRPGAEVPIDMLGWPAHKPDAKNSVVSLSDMDDPEASPLVEAFSSSPLPPFRIVKNGDVRCVVMAGDAFGVRSAVDLCFGIASKNAKSLYQPESGPPIRGSAVATIGIPVKKLILNVLLEDTVFPGSEPELMLYRTHERGPARPGDPDREFDRMDSTATIQFLGRGPRSFHVTEFARHVELVQYMCDKFGWDINRLRGYRCSVQYPLVVAQYSIAFQPPYRDSRK